MKHDYYLRRIIRARFAAVLSALLLGLGACVGDTTGSLDAVSISVNPQAPTIVQGGTLALAVTITRRGNFAGPVEIGATTLPPGITANVDTIVSGATSGTLTLRASTNAAPVTGTVVVSTLATGVRTSTKGLPLTIAVAGSYTLSIAPDTFYVPFGVANLQTSVRLSGTSDFRGTVNVSASSSVLTATLTGSTLNASNPSLPVNLVLPATLPAGDHTVELRGVIPGLPDQVAKIVVRVNPPVPFLFVNPPGDIRAIRNTVTPTAFRIARGGGFAGPITLSATNLPAGVTAAFAITPSGDSAVVSFTVAPTVATGLYPIAIEASATGALRSTRSVALFVVAPTSLISMQFGDLNTEVGKPVETRPSLRVVDAQGIGIAGVPVQFAPRGPGTVTGGLQITDADGVATVGSWTIGTMAYVRYVLGASVVGIRDTLTFGSGASAGFPATITAVSGDGQTGNRERYLVESLVVRVADVYNNAISGIPVTFATAPGSGSVNTPVFTVGGIATTSWRLGLGDPASPTIQTATARVGALTPVTFTAITQSCEPKPYQIGETVSGNLSDYTSCLLPDVDTYGDAYMLTLTQLRVFSLTANLTGNASVSITDSTKSQATSRFVLNAMSGAPQYFVLVPGTYSLTARVQGYYGEGSYQISTTPLSMSDLAGCITVSTTRADVEIAGTVNAFDCSSPRGQYDRYAVYLRRGQALTASAVSSTPSIIEISPALTAASTTPSLTYTAATDGMYVITLYNAGPVATTMSYSLRVR